MEQFVKKVTTVDYVTIEGKTEQEASIGSESFPASAMSRKVALLFAIACGLAVANIYYAQPLLDAISKEFGITHSSVGIVITITQVCYALGLLLLVPLGDLLHRRWLIAGQMIVSVLALIVVGTATTSLVLFKA